MRTRHRSTASLIAAAVFVLATTPAVAAAIDVNVMLPGAPVQPVQPVYMPRPDYIDARHEADWRERQARALAWQSNPQNHGQVVSAAAHARNEDRKEFKKQAKKDKKHNKNGKSKHH
jgi:hypothetical protein